jgi:hypothetical protein
MTVTRNTDGKHAKSTRFTLCADLVSYTSLFPYINQQVGELGIAENEDRVGYYSGVVEAVFAGVQFFTVYHPDPFSQRCQNQRQTSRCHRTISIGPDTGSSHTQTNVTKNLRRASLHLFFSSISCTAIM